uniref:Putative secreted protein n=1 Tax=Anopheles darlingi TaxID=43151 RepID=A0A2M4D874_ANODA
MFFVLMFFFVCCLFTIRKRTPFNSAALLGLLRFSDALYDTVHSVYWNEKINIHHSQWQKWNDGLGYIASGAILLTTLNGYFSVRVG